MRLILGIIIWAILCASALAHEVRPAFLSLTETTPSQFSVTWKQPVLDGKRLKIVPKRSVLNCGLIEGEITLAGLERTLTDVFVEINYLNGETRTALIKPSNPTITLGGKASSAAKHYLWLGSWLGSFALCHWLNATRGEAANFRRRHGLYACS